MNKIKFFALIFAVVVAAVAGGAAPANAQDGGWDAAICEGAEGYIFRTVDGTTSSLDAESGCEPDEDLAWLLVEPWNRSTNNPDRACLAQEWSDVVDVATRIEWTEGSIWRVSAAMADNPLVVDCGEVENRADLGLNPGEGQIELRQINATIIRANELLQASGMSMATYASDYPDHPITQLFLLIVTLQMGN